MIDKKGQMSFWREISCEIYQLGMTSKRARNYY